MSTRGLAVAGLVALCYLGVAPHAQAEKGDMHVRFGVVYNAPTDDLMEGGQTTELDDALGAQASFEYQPAATIGVEPALTFATHDVGVEGGGSPEFDLGEIDLLTLTVNLNFHVLPKSKVDLFLGPTVGYAFWGDLKTDMFPEDYPAEDEFTWGFNLGIDVPFGSGRWAFSAVADYLVLDATLEGSAPSSDLGVDPFQLKVGAAVKF